MSEPGKEKQKFSTAGKYLARIVMAILCLSALLVLAVTLYLSTPFPAQQVSRMASSYLQQNFSVDSLRTTGGTLYLRGVRLENPPGFPKGTLAEADSVAISPRWVEFLSGSHSLRRIALDGVRVNLAKNSAGVWNFSALQQLLASKKTSPTETRIGQFSVKDGSVSIEGQRLQGIALQVFNLTTKGSLQSKIDLGFEDSARNRYALKGTARPGTDPALDLTLNAPSLDLPGVASLLKLKNPGLFKGGSGSLLINGSLQKGQLGATGTFRFGQLSYFAGGRSFPLTGSLQFAGSYNLSRDAARLENCLLAIDHLVQVRAQGEAQALKKERFFDLQLGFTEVDLDALNALVPDQTRRGLTFGGRLGGQTLHLAGNGGKISKASGTLELRDGTIAREGRLLASGLAGTIGFSRSTEGVLAKGRLSMVRPGGKPLLEALSMPFELGLSGKLKLLKAEFPAVAAQLQGTPFTGRLAFDASKASPLAVSLDVPSVRVATLGPLLERIGMTASAGTASIKLEAKGRNLQQLAGTAGVQLADFQGARGKNALKVQRGEIGGEVRRTAGHLFAQGKARFTGLNINGKGGDARFNYRISEQTAFIEAAEINAFGAKVSIARLSAAVPAGKAAARPGGWPIAADFSGCSVQRQDLDVSSLAGRVRGSLQGDSAGRWLEGNADLSAGRVAWQGKEVAAPMAQVAFSRPGARAELGGKLLGGVLSGTVSGNPFALEAGGSFSVGLKGAELASAASLLKKGTTTPTDGLIELQASGAYSRSAGLSCRFTSKGSRVALAGAGKKSLVSGAAFNLAGELAGDNLTISDALFSPGPGTALKIMGRLEHPFTAGRTGNLAFSLPAAAARSIVTPLINLMPRAIQEATLDGTLAADGKLELGQGRKMLEGTLAFRDGGFELPSQKLAISGINGRFPISLDLSGRSGGKPPSAMAFSRENYPMLLRQLRSGSRGGEVITVGKLSFGPVELGTTTLHLSAANGLTQISSLETSLYEGALLGKGYLTMREGLGYRGDLLLNDLSLKRFCSMFPGITGYISGRVDGVISISGAANGLAGITGFSELWAHEGSREKMLVSKEFLQRLAKQKLGGFFFRSDRSYDQAEVKVLMEQGYLTFQTLELVHTNLLGVRDLNVSIAPTQNRIALDHLFDSIKQAAARGKATTKEPVPAAPPPANEEFKWGE
jgi:hypothetical protein